MLREVFEKGKRATATLTEQSLGLSPPDVGLMRELTLGVLRWRTALDQELSSASRFPLSRLAPNLREILEVALHQIRFLDRVPHHAAVDEAVRHARASGGVRAAKFVNAVLRTLLRAPDHKSQITNHKFSDEDSPAQLALHFSHPEFLVARWLERFGPETTRRILESDNASSPLDLMTNTRRGDRDSLAAELRREGIETEASPISPLGLVVTRGNPLRSAAFDSGRFTIQDVGAQALPLLLPAGETLIDLAAAPGGKSFAALLLGRAKHTVAIDRSVSRLQLLCENRRRLGIGEVRPCAANIGNLPLTAGESDRVLFDAPCSGTGTLRKNPEIRYRVTPPAIDRLAAAQREGLRFAARHLRPGGFLLYSTCSLEREENEAVVDDVLAADATLELSPIEVPSALAPFAAGARFQILPAPSSDGFTAHLLRRRREP